MKSSSERNIRASVQGRNGHQVWAFTPVVDRAFQALRRSHAVPDHIFLVIAYGNVAYGFARLSSRPDEERYGGLGFWPDQFEHAGNGNFEVEWIHECIEPFIRLEHNPPLSALPNGQLLDERGFEICNLLLKCPREPRAQRVLSSSVHPRPISAEGIRNHASHALVSRPLLSEFVSVALQDHQSAAASDQAALIHPDEASQIARSMASSWREVAGELPTQPAREVECMETEMQEEHIYVINFNRNPNELEQCLHEGDELEALRFFTAARGYPCRLEGGGSIFVHPEQHTQVRSQITARHRKLGPTNFKFILL